MYITLKQLIVFISLFTLAKFSQATVCTGLNVLPYTSGNLSDGSGGNYSGALSCRFLIAPSGDVGSVVLAFTLFRTAMPPPGQPASLQIYQGASTSSARVGALSGILDPFSFTVLSPQVLLVFDTAAVPGGAGWEATWSSVPNGLCSGTRYYSAFQDSITVGTADGNYTSNMQCTFVIFPSSPAFPIVLHFDSFQTTITDTLRIYSGSLPQGPLIQSLSGSMVPEDIVVYSSMVTLVWQSSSPITNHGWTLNYVATPCIGPCPSPPSAPWGDYVLWILLAAGVMFGAALVIMLFCLCRRCRKKKREEDDERAPLIFNHNHIQRPSTVSITSATGIPVSLPINYSRSPSSFTSPPRQPMHARHDSISTAIVVAASVTSIDPYGKLPPEPAAVVQARDQSINQSLRSGASVPAYGQPATPSTQHTSYRARFEAPDQ